MRKALHTPYVQRIFHNFSEYGFLFLPEFFLLKKHRILIEQHIKMLCSEKLQVGMWSTDCLTNLPTKLTALLIYRPNWLTDRLINCLTNWLTDWLTDWLTKLTDGLTDRGTDRRMDGLTEWLSDLLTDRLHDRLCD